MQGGNRAVLVQILMISDGDNITCLPNPRPGHDQLPFSPEL